MKTPSSEYLERGDHRTRILTRKTRYIIINQRGTIDTKPPPQSTSRKSEYIAGKIICSRQSVRVEPRNAVVFEGQLCQRARSPFSLVSRGHSNTRPWNYVLARKWTTSEIMKCILKGTHNKWRYAYVVSSYSSNFSGAVKNVTIKILRKWCNASPSPQD